MSLSSSLSRASEPAVCQLLRPSQIHPIGLADSPALVVTVETGMTAILVYRERYEWNCRLRYDHYRTLHQRAMVLGMLRNFDRYLDPRGRENLR